jgi:Prenyltransferase and squalene oxidase repeat
MTLPSVARACLLLLACAPALLAQVEDGAATKKDGKQEALKELGYTGDTSAQQQQQAVVPPRPAPGKAPPPAPAAAWTQQPVGDAGTDITPESVAAVDRALAWLASTQNPDGSWTADVGFKLNQNYEVTANDQHHVGVTALAGLAFLAAGNLPGRGRYGNTIGRATDFVLDCVNEEGFIAAHDTRMYSHAFGTLFLAEVYGMTDRADVRDKLQSAVDYIVACQNQEGAWRYMPFAVESDMSITVCQLNALRGARNVGIRVPRSTIDRAAAYVARSYETQDESDYGYGFGSDNYYRLGKGSFKYQVNRQTRSSFALTAAGIAALHNTGNYGTSLQATPADKKLASTIDLNASIDFLLDHYDLVSGSSPYTFHYFYWYGHYYATQALYVIGGKAWAWYYPKMREELVHGQLASGAWPCTAGPGQSFSTAVGAIILSLPYGYLPIFQR